MRAHLLPPLCRSFRSRCFHSTHTHRAPSAVALLDFVRQRSKAVSSNLETRFSTLSSEISRLSGYTEIEGLKRDIQNYEKLLQDARDIAKKAKTLYTAAVGSRSASQRETNDLLSRKNSWNSNDISRFTELVRQDHINEQAERDSRAELDVSEEAVDRGFTLLMRAILARYHEEQVWSDKIRSLSTYGSLAITAANVLVFVLALMIVEPWRRRRLVDKLEAQMVIREQHIVEQTEQSLALILARLESVQVPAFVETDNPATLIQAETQAFPSKATVSRIWHDVKDGKLYQDETILILSTFSLGAALAFLGTLVFHK